MVAGVDMLNKTDKLLLSVPQEEEHIAYKPTQQIRKPIRSPLTRIMPSQMSKNKQKKVGELCRPMATPSSWMRYLASKTKAEEVAIKSITLTKSKVGL